MGEWATDEVRAIPLHSLDERYQRYRLCVPQAERVMKRSLARYGQMAPIVVWCQEEATVLIDGFKRLRAARQLKGMTSLWARRIEVDEQGAKAAIYNLNRIGRRPQELEEAWIVQALVREDGLSQVEAAALLSRHKSWVCRRLALLEKLSAAARDELRLGLLTPSLARQLVRLPVGNQDAVLRTMHEESLNSVELRGAVDLLLAAGTREQQQFVLQKPRQALRQAEGCFVPSWDPRLSTAGNRLARLLGLLLEQLAKVQSWLDHRGRSQLMGCDRQPLEPALVRLARETRVVAEATDDFLKELREP
jgi:hypothetical protein